MRFLLFLVLQALVTTAMAQAVGRVDFSAGIVRIERGTQTIVAVRGTEVAEGDVVVTGPDTQVQIRMADDAFLALRPNARLALEKYHFKQGADDGVLLSLAHGVLRAFTGAIATRDRSKFVMKTPLATVGIRGSGNILAHLGEEGTVNHTITGAHSVTARTASGELVTVVSRPGQTVQVRPGAAPRFVPTPSFIFAAASSAPPAQVAATSSSTTSGGGGTGSGSPGGAAASGGDSSGGSSSSTADSSVTSTSSSTASTTTASTSSSNPSTSSGPSASPGIVTGSTTSPSSNVQTSVAPANVRMAGGGGGSSGPGASVAIIADVLVPSGPRAAIFAYDQDPGYSVIGRDGNGFLTSATNLYYSSMPGAYYPEDNLTTASVQVTGGTGSDYFSNVEGNIKMGRLQNATIAVTDYCPCGSSGTRIDQTAPGGMAFVIYDETPRGVVLSYTGTTTFRLDGSTRPIDAHGNAGTVNSATMNANFTDRTLDFTFNLTVNNLVYNASATAVSFDGVRFYTYHDGTPTNNGLQVSCTGAGCHGGGYRGAVNGSFAGTGTNAWLGYHLFPTDNTDLVNGAIAFVANTVPTPRWTLPTTGTWNMVLIDNYVGVNGNFPTFTTAANAHINFSTQRADFTFNFDRVLTPADTAAGFQPQHITASAADLPMQGVGFVAQTGNPNRPSNLNVSCTGCSPTAAPVGRFEGYLSYVAPNPAEGGNVNIYWYLSNNTQGTLGYDYYGSSYFGNAPTPRVAIAGPAAPVAASPSQLVRLPDSMRGALRPPR